MKHCKLGLGLLALIVALAAMVIPATLGGALTENGTQPHLKYPLIEPNTCTTCHGEYDGGANIEPYDTWAGSMMAQAGRDPIFWAALDVANHDVPGIGDFCLRCHSPQGWLAGHVEPPRGSVDGCTLNGPMDDIENDFEGVTCHLCHRMMPLKADPPGQQAVYFENGQYWIDDVRCPDGPDSEPCRRGPYDYRRPEPPRTIPPPHNWAHSDYHENGDLCGNCHNVSNPLLNLIEDGVDTGRPYPVERTFREWRQSAYANKLGPNYLTCQNCHMPDAQEEPAYACVLSTNNRSGDMPTHQFVGGNAWIPEVLRQEYPNLNLNLQFSATRDWALDMLQNQSALVEITVPGDVVGGRELEAAVKVTNLAGHKLPTGYAEGRRMWIHIQAHDANSALIWESGAYDPVSGILTVDDQIKIYRADQGSWNDKTANCDIEDELGRPAFHFVLSNCFKIDNRIPPLGFRGMRDIETQPKKYGYPETSPGSGILVNHDVTDYVIPIPPGTPGPVNVTATLRYQTTSKEYVEFLLQEAQEHDFPPDCIERTDGFPTESRAQLLMNMWNLYDKSPPVDVGAASGNTNVTALLGDVDDVVATDHGPVTSEISISHSEATRATGRDKP